MTLHVMDADFTLLGEIVNYSSLRITRIWAGVGTFSLRVSVREGQGAGIAVGRILVPVEAPERSMLVRAITVTDGKQEMDVSGQTLSGYLTQRITLPPSASDTTFGYDRIIADAESVMKHYVANNVSSPEDVKRQMDCIVLEENMHRGQSAVPWSTRFEALDQVLKEIGTYADAGFDVIPDFAQRKFLFRYLPGRDLTGTDGSAVTFAVEIGSADSVAYKDDITKERTTAYIGGKGDDENRDIISVGTNVTGIERREMFSDAGSAEGADELYYEGGRKLADNVRAQSLTANVQNIPAMRYGVHWDLGDKVNVVSARAQMQARITQIQEAYEVGRAVVLTVTFGSPPRGIAEAVQALRNVKVR